MSIDKLIEDNYFKKKKTLSLTEEEISTGKIWFRPALLSDFDAIMAFGDQYGGRDYFWALYEEFLSDPDNICLVALVKDTMVGYAMTGLIDGGVSVVGRCGRVDPRLRRRGIFVALQDELDRLAMQKFETLLYETFSKETKAKTVESITPYRPGYNAVCSGKIVAVCFPQNTMRSDGIENSSQSYSYVKRLGYADLKLLLHTDAVASELFPSRRLFHFMVGYRLLEANVRHILCKRSCVLVSLEQRHDSESCHSGPGTSSGNRLCKTETESSCNQLDVHSVHRVSMMTNYLCYPTRDGKGFSVILHIHARPDMPHRDLTGHLRYLKGDMQRRFPGRDGVVTAMYATPLRRGQVLSCFRDVGFSEAIPDSDSLVVLWERPKGNICPKL
ncbi:hypothetical protein ElyMa_002938800 [Elysia marginata]|uniref:N-acetyltransferase domain-containing protein n=1 Tax=Elysia marginata TaxID=1093978 RepID=A0AAV4I532_9GAST|nr:hypothetical protein ElyMa_002938800 [Elysia marginata]